MTAHPHTLAGPCAGARTFGVSVRWCVRCGQLLPKDDHYPRLEWAVRHINAVPTGGDVLRLNGTPAMHGPALLPKNV